MAPLFWQKIRATLCALLLCLLHSTLSANEGIDYTTGGNWNTSSVDKPWSYDGQNLYGTAGYHFFNLTPEGGKGKAHRPVVENLQSALPSYIEAITPVENAYTSHSFGYLPIDAPKSSAGKTLESGLLAILPPDENARVELLSIQLGDINDIYGFRLGILVANADRKDLTPEAIVLHTADGHWNRSVINLPTRSNGMWIFFNVSAKHANQRLILSVKPRNSQPAAIGGLVFDDLEVAPQTQPLNVFSDKAVSPSGSIVWNAAPRSEAPASESDSWEHTLAQKLSKAYRLNEARIADIQTELNRLPKPYTGEPTGTGGFLSHWSGSSKNDVVLNFRWSEPQEIDAVALFPLRLFLADENGLTNNAYWPGKIQIQSVNEAEPLLLQTVAIQNRALTQSLPEITTFPTQVTSHLRITLSDLTRKNGGFQFAGGFSEICIFSGQENIAPRARVHANQSREGFRVFSRTYLTDGHTPLGLPEIGPRTSGSLGLSIRSSKRTPAKPVDIVVDFKKGTAVDAVRLDPAAIYKPGQAFPIRFTIELLDAQGTILQADNTYRDTPLRDLGLNPYFAYFPETLTHQIRVRIIEMSQPRIQSRPWIQISEITPIYRGAHIRTSATIDAPSMPRRASSTAIYDPSGRQLRWQNEFVYDGQTQTGQTLPLREWTEGLQQRKRLIEELHDLKASQEATIHGIRRQTLWAAGIFLSLVVMIALFLVIRAKVNNRRELRLARERIASDLHDDVGSNLGTITLHTEFLMDQVDAPDQVEHLKSITKLTRESVYGLREVLHTSAPRIGRAQDILQYMEELSQLVLPDIELKMDLAPSVNAVMKTPELRKGVMLYYKEAITNIRSHAQCQRVSVSLHELRGYLELMVKDDGIGMPLEKLSNESTLRTLKLRANEMRAELKIESKVNQGTRLDLKIPLK
ncbi:MAG: sensor histidine kinase [Opitutaceae bacterium]